MMYCTVVRESLTHRRSHHGRLEQVSQYAVCGAVHEAPHVLVRTVLSFGRRAAVRRHIVATVG